MNDRSICQASDKVFFISDDLKFQSFSITDFNTEQLRLADPVLSDPVNDLFGTFASAYRDKISLTNYTFSQYTQIWISFSDGASGLSGSQNFNTFVYDYSTNGGKGGWHIHTTIEVASAVLARDATLNYYMFAGDYYGFVWQYGLTDGDGAIINGISSGSNTSTSFKDTLASFSGSLVGTFIRIIDGYGIGQIRRITAVPSATELTISPAWTQTPTNTSDYTIGGIDFQLWSRYDWLDETQPPDFDKYLWYFDVDIEVSGSYGYDVTFFTDRNLTSSQARAFTYYGAAWGTGIWGVSLWGVTWKQFAQTGLDLHCKTVLHAIVNQYAGQPLKVNGWTYAFQNLQHVRTCP